MAFERFSLRKTLKQEKIFLEEKSIYLKIPYKFISFQNLTLFVSQTATKMQIMPQS